jgi:hypothetical protein
MYQLLLCLLENALELSAAGGVAILEELGTDVCAT